MIRIADLPRTGRHQDAKLLLRIGADTPAELATVKAALAAVGWTAAGWYAEGLIFDVSTDSVRSANEARAALAGVGAQPVKSLPEPALNDLGRADAKRHGYAVAKG